MSAALGQPVVVENKGGAGGVLGNDAVAKATDGCTIGLSGTGALVAAPHLMKMPYSPADAKWEAVIKRGNITAN